MPSLPPIQIPGKENRNRELWWAHTGGGGNFGIVTRYWLRTPDSTGTDPYSALPKAPTPITTFRVAWIGRLLMRHHFVLRKTSAHGASSTVVPTPPTPNYSAYFF